MTWLESDLIEFSDKTIRKFQSFQKIFIFSQKNVSSSSLPNARPIYIDPWEESNFWTCSAGSTRWENSGDDFMKIPCVWINSEKMEQYEHVTGITKRVKISSKKKWFSKWRIFIGDETGLWTGNVVSKPYINPVSNGDANVDQPGDHMRDTGMVTLSASRNIGPSFIKQKIKEQNKKMEK